MRMGISETVRDATLFESVAQHAGHASLNGMGNHVWLFYMRFHCHYFKLLITKA